MQNIVIDAFMRVIPDSTRCHIIFPGNGYRNYFDFRDNEVVYLDFPGLPLNSVDLERGVGDWEARITVSDRIKEWYSKGRDPLNIPPRKIQDLQTSRSSQRKRLFAGLLESFFNRLQPGDVIVVPSQGQQDEVLFGEILDDAGTFVSHKHPGLKGEFVPARRVRWVARPKRADVPRWLDEKLPSPNPLRLIESPSRKS